MSFAAGHKRIGKSRAANSPPSRKRFKGGKQISHLNDERNEAHPMEITSLFVDDSDDSVQAGFRSAIEQPATKLTAEGPTARERASSNLSPSPITNAQIPLKGGFLEPLAHPNRGPLYVRPRFKSSEFGQPTSAGQTDASKGPTSCGTYESDLDEGAAGYSSDNSSDDSALLRRLAREPVRKGSGLSAAQLEKESEQRRESARNRVDDSLVSEESIVPDSQPDPHSDDTSRLRDSTHDLRPSDSILNTTTCAIVDMSPPSALTLDSQEASCSMSRETLFRSLQKDDYRVYILHDFIQKHLPSLAALNSYPKLREALSTYVVSQRSQVDSPAMMQTRHKELAQQGAMSSEKFFRRVLYEIHMRQKNAQVDTEILYGPWHDLAIAIGRPMIVFILVYANVYKPLGGSQWLQLSGEVPRYQPSRNSSFSPGDVFVTKSDVVFRHCSATHMLKLPPLTTSMQRAFPSSLKAMIRKVEGRARPMRFLFGSVPINTEGWTPRKKVAKFLMLCAAKLLPRTLLGTRKNDCALEKTVRRFINMSATAKMPLGQAGHGIKLKDIPWTQQLFSGGDDKKKSGTMLLFWEWLFNHFLKPMLAHHFYMTEMSGVPGSLYYYELSEWSRTIKALGTKAFIEQHGGRERLASGKDGERLRFVPKQSGGVRPIINLKAFNQTLKLAHVVLQSLPRSPTRLSSWQNWVLHLQAFKEHHKLQDGAKYYAVKLDISGCYDNLRKEKLEQIVRRLLDSGETEFWLQVFSVFNSHSRTIKDQSVALPASHLFEEASAEVTKTLAPIEENRHPGQHPLIYFSRASGNLRIQGSRLPPDKRLLHGFPYSGQDVLDDLASLIHGLKIQVKQAKTMLFEAGIPQGSSCSLDLCNLFLDDLVHSKLSDFIEDDRCLLLRYVDDFLFVSTSRELAQRYQDIMLRGFGDEYGVSCKMEKQQTNLVGKHAKMEYLGHLFDPDTLELYPRNVKLSASLAPVPMHKKAQIQRMHLNLESILGILRSYQRAGVDAPIMLEKRISRAFGRFVADSFKTCCAFTNCVDHRTVFQKIVRVKLLPLVCADRRTSMLKSAQNVFMLRMEAREKKLKSQRRR